MKNDSSADNRISLFSLPHKWYRFGVIVFVFSVIVYSIIEYRQPLDSEEVSDSHKRLRATFNHTSRFVPVAMVYTIALIEIGGISTVILQWYLEHREEAKRKAMAKARAEGLAQGRAEARAEGLAEGLAQGRAQGRAEALAEINAKAGDSAPDGVEENSEEPSKSE